jgi:hypothetical protein
MKSKKKVYFLKRIINKMRQPKKLYKNPIDFELEKMLFDLARSRSLIDD